MAHAPQLLGVDDNDSSASSHVDGGREESYPHNASYQVRKALIARLNRFMFLALSQLKKKLSGGVVAMWARLTALG
jgi:hypothetical protein